MKKFLAMMMAMVIGAWGMGAPVMATDGGLGIFGEASVSILKECGNEAEGTKGEGVICVLRLVVDIMSIGIGILGVIGISVTGIQYLTAGGNEEKTRKAKRRLFEVVIGLAAYALIYAVLSFLLPSL